MSNLEERSVCYIAHECSESSDKHFAHIPRLLAEIGKYVDLFVIVERAGGTVEIENARRVYVQQYQGKSLRRVIELVQIIQIVRQQGCRKFFWRASSWMALILGLLAPFLDIEIYFWSSGAVKKALPSWKLCRKRIAFEFAHLRLWLVAKLVHRFVTGPESMANYYVRSFGVRSDKVIILYNDIDVAQFTRLRTGSSKSSVRHKLGIPTDRMIVLFVGRVDFGKGGYNIIPIVADVLSQVQQVEFLIIGQVRINGFQDKLIDKGLQDSVMLLGAMPNHKVIKYYLAADILIVPSQYEGFPRVLLEAMALGLPFVVFDVGGVRDVGNQFQLESIIPSHNTSLFAQRVVKLLEKPELRARLAEVGQEQVKRYSTERVARMFIQRIVDA